MLRLDVSNLTRTDEEVAALGSHANRAHYESCIDRDAIVTGPTGIIARLVTGCLDPDLVKRTADHFRTVHGLPSNRGSIIGPDAMMNRERAGGSLGFIKEVPKSIIKKMKERKEFSDFLGWFDKSQTGDRFSYCRETAWSLENPEVLEAARPFVKRVDEVYRDELPHEWQAQREFMERVHPNFKFINSVYSTVTVNRNIRATYHRDKDDFRGGMGNLVVLVGGDGGELVIPKYRIAFAPRPTDVLLMNVHEVHGNLPIIGERLTAVLYAREHMHECVDGYTGTDDDLPGGLF
jgi:hypothetical protein